MRAPVPSMACELKTWQAFGCNRLKWKPLSVLDEMSAERKWLLEQSRIAVLMSGVLRLLRMSLATVVVLVLSVRLCLEMTVLVVIAT